MKSTKLRVRRYHHSTTSRWVVEGIKENGKRKRFFFETEGEAKTWAEFRQVEINNHGTQALALSDDVRVMAFKGNERLKTFGKSIEDAVNHYIGYLEACNRSCTISDLIEKFIESKQRANRSHALLVTLRSRLGRFKKTFGDKIAATVMTLEIDEWLQSLDVASETKNNFRKELVGLFNYAVKRQFAEFNPAIATERVENPGEVPGILETNDLVLLLSAATPEILPYLAIGAFAGLRASEIQRLEWKNINLSTGLIEVSAKKSKTKQRRFVKIHPNLKAWLQPYNRHQGMVCQANHRKNFEAVRRTAGLDEWPDNALRHSFGSYALAHFKNVNELALEMGNSPEMIFKHYRELVTPENAARYWNIMPGTAEEKVVAFAAT